MGNDCFTERDPEATKVSQGIEVALRKERERVARQHEQKILLLGPGESGKSTIFKQMKIIQDNGGFSPQELAGFNHVVHANAISQMRVLVQVAARQRVPLQSAENIKHAMLLVSLPPTGAQWSKEVGTAIKALWFDNGIRSVYALAGSLFQLNDSAQYFFDSIDRFLDEAYVPSIDDVLRVRVRSTGIEEALFVFDRMTFKVMDVGGQRSERRKWFHCFPEVTAVLFVVALSGFDQVLREESTVNRMTESISLFEDVVNSPFFQQAAIILFLNKVDLFAEKLRRGIALNKLFPNYTGGQDADRALQFVTSRFSERVNDARHLYVHQIGRAHV